MDRAMVLAAKGECEDTAQPREALSPMKPWVLQGGMYPYSS